ncbi:MAG TPA: class I SAM-dependent methyltransferase [Leptospiraceae bacterium]|nr:class I SAM-dependent methyltransferase [Leptospiraceae bacterium]HMW08293.1 class I SAM-dependent methyltransferase [Leptospiraceae bacterium]HMX33130.1 class I SAM-dependent methyltransferase [Leptospiraceae bacterium]HMY34011.1 class I SAM-dependent methyltransferase [Leptospiraceae bacterium]HMZ63079.1 class I SAM-dependent methyltransferase [Leptospiraceae bacterium]
MKKKDRRNTIRIRLHDVEKSYILLLINGRELKGKIYDYSRFGLGICIPKSESAFIKKTQPIENCIIFAYGDKKELGTGTVVHLDSMNDEIFLGVFLEREFIDMDTLMDKQSLFLQEDEVKKIRMQFTIQEDLEPNFILFCSKFVYGLSLYKIALDELDDKFAKEPNRLKEALFQSVLKGVGGEFYEFLTAKIEELKVLTKEFTKLQNEKYGFYLRKSIWNYILESEFIKRTNLKPRGYAGDSAMMEMLYRNEYLGKSSFGKIFHKHPCDTKAADAVRNRRRLINKYMSQRLSTSGKDDFKILSIACGPAWEMQDFLRESPYKHQAKVYLLDQDEEALGEAKSGIDSIPTEKPFQVEFIKESVRTILKTGSPELKFGQYDFIYSMGLYDYLTDSVAKVLTEKLYSMLCPGGILILGNYHVENETRKYMEYIMDWVLYYRDEEAMFELLEDIPKGFTSEVGFDDSGTQMFLRVEKNR